jgi:alpha-methylacyl-CoA racemase
LTNDERKVAMSGPLQGLRIVELAAIGPAPFAGALLADLGADVVRVDRLPVPGGVADPPARYDFYNRNKRSVAVDLKRPEGVETVCRWWRARTRCSKGFARRHRASGRRTGRCLAANPRLVYARMTGWGQDGPWAREAGHDINYLALTGALHSIGAPSNRHRR